MYQMFCKASSFTSDLSAWQVGQVTNMQQMFSGADSFSSDLSAWQVGQVTTMLQMFTASAMAVDVRAPVGPWDVANIDTNGMYSGSCLEDASKCQTACPAGSWNSVALPFLACITCAAGRYIDVPGSVEASDCIACVAGTYTNVLGGVEAAGCIACVAGTYPNLTLGTYRCDASCVQFDCVASSQQLIDQAWLTGGDDATTCCQDIVGRCSGNTDSTTNFDCSSTSQQLIVSSEFTDGSTAVICCQDIVGRCSGNTDSTTNFDCSSTSQQLIAASTVVGGVTAEACCEDVVGRCSGNTDSSGDFDCSATSQQLISSSTFTDGSTAQQCCADITERCSGNTNPNEDFDCSATSQQLIAASDDTIGSDAATCCVDAACIPSDLVGAEAKCCVDIRGRCSGNTDAATDVNCSATSQNIIDAATTTVGNTVEMCCENVVGMCSGNLDPSSDFDCSTSGQTLILTFATTRGNTPEVCCEAIRCAGSTAGDFDCSDTNQALIPAAAATVGYDTTTCCEDPFGGLCSGNTDPSQDFECDAASHLIPTSATTVGNTAEVCCEDNGILRGRPAPGFYMVAGDLPSLAICVPPEACLGGQFGEATCAPGYGGSRCAQCSTTEPKYYRRDGVCEKCDTILPLWLLVILAVVVFVTTALFADRFLSKVRNVSVLLAPLMILLTFFQTMALLLKVSLKWPPQLRALLRALSFM
jgi:surface protein